MMYFSIQSGRQSGVKSALEADTNYLLGASVDNDFVLSDAGAARAMLRLERSDPKLRATVTALAGSVVFGGQPVPQGGSLVLDLPASLVLQDLTLELGAASDSEAAGPLLATLGAPAERAAAAAPPPAPAAGAMVSEERRPRQQKSHTGVGVVLALVVLCSALFLYAEELEQLTLRNAALSADSQMLELKQRWSQVAGVQLVWGPAHPKGKMSLRAFVPDAATERRLKNDIRKSGLALDLKVTNGQELVRKIEGEMDIRGTQVLWGPAGGNKLSLQMESEQWARFRSKLNSADFFRDGIAEVGVTLLDAWDYQTRRPLFLRLNREGAMDKPTSHAMENMGKVLLPDGVRKNLASVELGPQPALVTRQKQRFALGAILANGAELISVNDQWVVIAQHGIIRKHKLI